MIITWHIFEILGTIAFAFSGVMVGISKKMDIFGIAVLAIVTAIGGGIMRDVMVGMIPPLSLRTPDNLIISLITVTMAIIGMKIFYLPTAEKSLLSHLYQLSDAIGLASFTVTGAMMGIGRYPEYSILLPIMLALLTAIGGGIIRDVLAQRMPVVFYMEIYAVASLVGAVFICAAKTYIGIACASWVGFFIVLILRLLAIAFRWNLYHPVK